MLMQLALVCLSVALRDNPHGNSKCFEMIKGLYNDRAAMRILAIYLNCA